MDHIDFDDRRERTLVSVLARQAELRPDAPYVLTDDTCWTYGDVHTRAEEYAAGLHELGVGAGDTVALFMDSWPEIVPLVFAVNRLGAIWTPINIDYRGEWLHQTVVDGAARVLVADGDLVARLAPVVDGTRLEHVVVRGRPAGELPTAVEVHELTSLARPGGFIPDVDIAYTDTAAVLWTSGTTGRSKGVMQSHNAWVRASLSGARSSVTTERDVLYCCVPLYNSGGWVAVVFRALVAGASFALDRKFSVSTFWERVRHHGATQAFTLGAMHIFLWQAPGRADDADNPLRCMSAIPMPDAILEPFMQRFGLESIQQGYGQSEVMGLVSRNDDGTTRWNPGSAGTPHADIEVRLLDDDGDEVAIGDVGEFCVRPRQPAVMFNGYFRNPEATLRAYRDLWYHTGDLGRVDADGQYHFVDRKDDYIRFKGRSISSFDVERAFTQHEAVAQAVACGVESELLASEAELLVAVVLHPGARTTPDELARFVNDTAPYFFVPRYIDIVDELPYTPTGKAQKYKIRRRGVGPSTWDRDVAGFDVRR